VGSNSLSSCFDWVIIAPAKCKSSLLHLSSYPYFRGRPYSFLLKEVDSHMHGPRCLGQLRSGHGNFEYGTVTIGEHGTAATLGMVLLPL
jgi:hypothetical protein